MDLTELQMSGFTTKGHVLGLPRTLLAIDFANLIFSASIVLLTSKVSDYCLTSPRRGKDNPRVLGRIPNVEQQHQPHLKR